jgi:hypothetical protein
VNAVNPWSGACGIPQAVPCSKMASVGPDYRTSARVQILWGLRYIAAVYGKPAHGLDPRGAGRLVLIGRAAGSDARSGGTEHDYWAPRPGSARARSQ